MLFLFIVSSCKSFNLVLESFCFCSCSKEAAVFTVICVLNMIIKDGKMALCWGRLQGSLCHTENCQDLELS